MAQTVRVNFIDAATNEIFAFSDMPPENLPQTFEISTTMHLGEDDWTVEKAEPAISAEFVKSGQLDLTLRKVERMPVEDILYSLPTIANDLGPIEDGSSKAGKKVLSFLEDDWRQFEFVSDRFEPEIEREFAAIREIWQKSSVQSDGMYLFKEIHVRQQIPLSIVTPFTLDQLLKIFPTSPEPYDGLSYDQSDGLVQNSFAFRVESALDFYGLAHDGAVQILGISLDSSTDQPSAQTIEALATFMADNSLSVVYWPNLAQSGSDPTQLAEFFEEIL